MPALFDDTDPDPDLPVLTRTQARRFHEELAKVFEAYRLAHHYDGGDAYTVDDGKFGLSNLAAFVAREPAEQWSRLVGDHVRTYIEVRHSAELEIALSQLHLRVRPQGGQQADYPFRDKIDGLEVVFAIDYPQYVTELDKLEMISHLGDLDLLIVSAYRNLHALPEPEHQIVPVDRGDETYALHVFQFDDYFGPSRILYLSQFVEPYIEHAPHGLLVIIPDRHTLAVQVVDERAMMAAGAMADIAQNLYETSPGATTPNVYHLSTDGSLTLVAYVTEMDGDQAIYLAPNAELSSVMFGATDRTPEE